MGATSFILVIYMRWAFNSLVYAHFEAGDKNGWGLLGWSGLVYWGLTPQQHPGSYQGGEMMMMKCQFHWWRKPEYSEKTTDRSNFHRPVPSPSSEPRPQRPWFCLILTEVDLVPCPYLPYVILSTLCTPNVTLSTLCHPIYPIYPMPPYLPYVTLCQQGFTLTLNSCPRELCPSVL